MKTLTIIIALFAVTACEKKEQPQESARKPAAPRVQSSEPVAAKTGGKEFAPAAEDTPQVAALKKELAAVRRERDEARSELEKLRSATGDSAAPKNARMIEPEPELKPLTPERRAAMLEGREKFNPGPIEESAILVTEQTKLENGQALQVKYGESWYAAEVMGFESDGGIHIRYFGWDSDWDEIVPRSDLRLDAQARERAVEKHGVDSGNVDSLNWSRRTRTLTSE